MDYNAEKDGLNEIHEIVCFNEKGVMEKYNKAKEDYLKISKTYVQYLDYKEYIMKKYLEFIKAEDSDEYHQTKIIKDTVFGYHKIKNILKDLGLKLIDNNKGTALDNIRDYVLSHEKEVIKKYEITRDYCDKTFKLLNKYLEDGKNGDNSSNRSRKLYDQFTEYDEAHYNCKRIFSLYDQYFDIEKDIMRKYSEFNSTSDVKRKDKIIKEVNLAYSRIKYILKDLELD